MSDRIRCGLLGTGHAHAIGKLHVLRDSSHYKLVGVCEPDDVEHPDSIGAVRAQRATEPNFADVRWLSESELLDDPTLQMIAVESRVQDNLTLARKAIDAGKHLHLDKPAGGTLAEFRELLNEASRRDLIVQMGYMFRYNTGFEFLLQAAREGWLGDIFQVRGSINSDITPTDRVQLAWHPGGMMFELGCHLIDILVLLFGRPSSVTPHLRHDAARDDALADNTLAVFEFDRTVAVIESAGMEANPFERRHLVVTGTMGTIVLQPLEPPAVRLSLREARGRYHPGWQTVEAPNVPRYVRDFEELARCIRGEQAFPYSTDHDYTVQETLLRACGVA